MTTQLNSNQQPLGSQFKSYELTAASNYWTLDPFQYSITKFKYNLPDQINNQAEVEVDSGLVYKQIDFEKLLPSYTSEKKSVNDFPAQSYHRFQANEGYFNPTESTDNKDLWYYAAEGLGGAGLNVQETNHIIFPEAQRGGLNSQLVAKYSSTPKVDSYQNDSTKSWEQENFQPIEDNCKLFNYNNRFSDNYNNDFNQVYRFDSVYCRNIGINSPSQGSMPFK